MSEIEHRMTRLETIQEFQGKRLNKIEAAVLDVVKLKWTAYGVGLMYVVDKLGLVGLVTGIL